MNGLRLNDICHVNHPIDLSFISNKLRMMELHDYPLKFMPMCFQPNNLVEFMMPRSCIEKLPEEFSVSFPLMHASAFFFNPPKISITFLSLGYLISHIYFLSQNLAKLRLLDLGDSKDFVKTPNFNGLPILEVLIFQGCTSLYELQLPVGALNRLTLLNLKDCKNLKSLPSKINLESLKIFILSGCSTLKKFPDIGKNMTILSELYLDGTAIEELPPSIEHLTGLSLLSLKDCKRLSRFPRVDLPSLKALILSG